MTEKSRISWNLHTSTTIITQELKLDSSFLEHSPLCSFYGCCKPVVKKKSVLCQRHYDYLKKSPHKPKGFKSTALAATEEESKHLSYNGAHRRIFYAYARPRYYRCIGTGCINTAQQWALLPGHENKTQGKQKYSTNPADYVPMCISCHSKLDAFIRHTQKYNGGYSLPGMGWKDFSQEFIGGEFCPEKYLIAEHTD